MREQSNKRSGTRMKTVRLGRDAKNTDCLFGYVILVQITRFSQPRAMPIG